MNIERFLWKRNIDYTRTCVEENTVDCGSIVSASYVTLVEQTDFLVTLCASWTPPALPDPGTPGETSMQKRPYPVFFALCLFVSRSSVYLFLSITRCMPCGRRLNSRNPTRLVKSKSSLSFPTLCLSVSHSLSLSLSLSSSLSIYLSIYLSPFKSLKDGYG